MNASPLKILVPLVLLLGVVFAITYFSQYTPSEPDDPKATKAEPEKKPLRFFSSTRRWNPAPGGSLQDREFPGFFEPGETNYSTSFWFENRNAATVRVQLKHVSCSTCSGGQVAPIPPELTKQILQMTAVSVLPQGLVSGFPLGLAAPAAHFDRTRTTLNWQHHVFTKAPEEVRYEVPAAPSGDLWAEQWAILELQFKVRPGASRAPLTAEFLTQLQGSEEISEERFAIIYESAQPFEFDKTAIDVGELTDLSATQNHEILIYSSTRDTAQLANLAVHVRMPTGTQEPGPFISAGKPVPIPEEQLEQLAMQMSFQAKQLIRVKSAFRLPVTVNAKVGAAKLDIGRMERIIHVTEGSETKQVRVHGSMRGPVYLVGAKEIGFGYFAGTDEQIVSVAVETERSGVELEIVKDLTVPKFLKVELLKQPDNGDRGAYKLKATLPANEQIGEIRDGVVVLETKGPNPLRLRIPVTGRGQPPRR